ncbi:MAG TPA: hypothetical protein VLV15_06880, partial [Dongiaceae bacterium]|nr:hypothetical protein [Dongiaceae bacterium]
RGYTGGYRGAFVRPVAPSRFHVWVPGYWGWNGGVRVWIGGAWLLPPYAGWSWVPAGWVWNGYTWVWANGHWGAPGSPAPAYPVPDYGY